MKLTEKQIQGIYDFATGSIDKCSQREGCTGCPLQEQGNPSELCLHITALYTSVVSNQLDNLINVCAGTTVPQQGTLNTADTDKHELACRLYMQKFPEYFTEEQLLEVLL